MSHPSIRAVQEAEEQAALLCRVAEERAEEMRARVRAEGEAHCTESERAAELEYTDTVAEIRRRSAAVKEKKRAEAEAEAAAITAAARARLDAAAALIVWEIIEKCQ